MGAAIPARVETGAISCSRCEAVCCRLQVILMPGDAPPRWLTEEDEHGLQVMRRGDDGWCVALDRNTMRCTIYEVRPFLCGEYEEGGHDCRIERKAWGFVDDAGDDCPPMNADERG